MDGLAAFILLTAIFAWLGGDHNGPDNPQE